VPISDPLYCRAGVRQFGDYVPPKHSLTEGSSAPALLFFSMPILFGNILQSVDGSVNAVWVGKEW
jgi:Na+-driven multidrug efflux pump